ncbi:hypothetical protein MBAV_004664 [Candidatus Magnetobacterium bavaricum]|uniref:Uncharacterized protein n=1 Tax=Candidatus Magnetobacterium bavaricum TaxID=29290 RepID=A0A0F3GMI7_9BACT|nr:hypothetical protein MBAV_004664 [Candidatus Magnetobacterium bavaricum]
MLAYLTVAQAVEAPSGDDYYIRQYDTINKKSDILKNLDDFRVFPHIDRAYKLMKSDKLQEAKTEIETALKKNPDNIKLILVYIDILYRLKLYKELISYADKAISLYPGLIPVILHRAEAQKELDNYEMALDDFRNVMNQENILKNDRIFAIKSAIHIIMRLKRYDDALALINKLKDIDKSFDTVYKEANILFEIGRYAEAESAFTYALSKADNDTDKKLVLKHLHIVLIKQGKVEQAFKMLTEALKYNPNDTTILKALVDITYEQKQYNESLKWMQKVVAVEDNDQNREFLASIKEQSGDYDGAIKELEGVLVRTKDTSSRYSTLTHLASLCEKVGKKELATKYYENAARLINDPAVILSDKQKASIHKSVAAIAKRQGNTEQALKSLTEALKYNPNDIIILKELVDITYKQKRYDECRKWMEKVVAVEDNTENRKFLASVSELIGDYDKTIKELERVLVHTKDKTSRYSILTHLASLCEKVGKQDLAEKYYEHAVRLINDSDVTLSDKQKAYVYKSLSIIAKKQGRIEQALKSLTEALKYSPNDISILKEFVDIAYKQEIYEESLQWIQRVIAVEDNDEK